MKLLITEVTEMHGGNYCVAGWRAKTQSMVRPLPNGANWTAQMLSDHGVVPGATLKVHATGVQATSAFPHRTEDTPIELAGIMLLDPGPAAWFGANSPPATSTLPSAFQDHLQNTNEWNGVKKGCYVTEGTSTCSLSAVALSANSIDFFEDDYNGKKSLRVHITDSKGKYNLPVSSKALRDLYRKSGVAALNQGLPGHQAVHIRVGLARAWDGQPGRCFIMVNGVQW